MTTIIVSNRGPDLLRIGVIHANNVDSGITLNDLEMRLNALLTRRSRGLTPEEDAWRASVRDIFRIGRYKPTGRGKPASEYLIRAAGSGSFPRINAPVDVCNYISLRALLPVSIWDVARSAARYFVVRTGVEGEEYVFNASGQTIGLEDLVVGCAAADCEDPGEPIVNPVKDSMKTKTSTDSRQIAAVVYGRPDDGPTGRLEELCSEFADLLAECGPYAQARFELAASGEQVEL